ncbi:hypothetical protein EVAR_58464_1 [Eumeta japonica]|uniref:Uncharacterized protein n=1 Tax=Eumeta variegata TaxID=151549 RepID=A0A4C1YNQ2_EUMVA|nr:hypothetical protein EVAR_58464_1 [Eumeta japonica]
MFTIKSNSFGTVVRACAAAGEKRGDVEEIITGVTVPVKCPPAVHHVVFHALPPFDAPPGPRLAVPLPGSCRLRRGHYSATTASLEFQRDIPQRRRADLDLGRFPARCARGEPIEKNLPKEKMKSPSPRAETRRSLFFRLD